VVARFGLITVANFHRLDLQQPPAAIATDMQDCRRRSQKRAPSRDTLRSLEAGSLAPGAAGLEHTGLWYGEITRSKHGAS
jgi:hypothetical protein